MRRRAGVLLHISSLPSKYGVGDFGPEAYRFVDFMQKSGLTIWQILPLNPTSPKFKSSPYHPLSSFGINYIFVSPEKLFEIGLIEGDLLEEESSITDKADYSFAYEFKRKVLKQAFEKFKNEEGELKLKFYFFCKENSWWLENYAKFQALREETEKEWFEWGSYDVSDETVEFFKFEQFILFEQWNELKKYANSKGIFIMGDIPIYPSYESCDVWCNLEIFNLDENLLPKTIAGVPPDFFSETGQLWGNPVYRWNELEKQDFSFWIDRLRFSFMLYDIVRLDHFRGFIAYWEVPYGEKTAKNGRWVRAPAEKFFTKITETFDINRIVVEDLGTLTDDVRYIRDKFGFCGMRVLEFAFYEKNSEHLPYNHPKNSVCYTGTHDLPPTKRWFKELDENTKKRLSLYIGKELDEENISWEMIRLAFSSPAKFSIVQMQDFIGEEERMNTPATSEGNWLWRINSSYTHLSPKIKEFCDIYGRT